MKAVLLLTLLAMPLIGQATPRQTALFPARALSDARRKTMRGIGWVLLASSFVLVLSGPDLGRHVIGWIGLLGIEAIVTALVFTLLSPKRETRQSPERPSNPATTVPLSHHAGVEHVLS